MSPSTAEALTRNLAKASDVAPALGREAQDTLAGVPILRDPRMTHGAADAFYDLGVWRKRVAEQNQYDQTPTIHTNENLPH
jgi:hypothetical protein